MPARDFFHRLVRIALDKANWQITHDPYLLQTGSFDLAIDLGAERIIAAQWEKLKIAVAVKSFLESSKISAFYSALGQFITYRFALRNLEPDRKLYLAVPDELYDKLFQTSLVRQIIEQEQVYLLTYDIFEEVICQWIPSPTTASAFNNC
jgi:hypothetical protein